jgi:ribosomal protein L37AE/L43A
VGLWEVDMGPRSTHEPGGGRYDLIARRAQRAIEQARQTVARSDVIAAAMTVNRDSDGLLVRCAWCDRYSLAGEWMPADELPRVWAVGRKLRAEQVTHSICPDCMRTS